MFSIKDTTLLTLSNLFLAFFIKTSTDKLYIYSSVTEDFILLRFWYVPDFKCYLISHAITINRCLILHSILYWVRKTLLEVIQMKFLLSLWAIDGDFHYLEVSLYIILSNPWLLFQLHVIIHQENLY